MRKKMLAVVLVLVFTLSPMTANALTLDKFYDDPPITVNFAYTSSTKTTMAISSSGVATVVGSITGYQGSTTKVVIYLYLQQYKSGTWTTVGSWSQISNNYYGTLSATKSVTKGYDYRLKASYYAYKGTASENIVSYSQTVKY